VTTTIVPVAKSLYLCDYHVGYSNGKTDLYGLFNAIRPQEYPFTRGRFCVFAQLVNGLGEVPFHVDVRWAPMDALVHTTTTHILSFPNRMSVVQMALSIEGIQFAQPGVYTVELFCDNVWVCDTTLSLREVSPGGQP